MNELIIYKLAFEKEMEIRRQVARRQPRDSYDAAPVPYSPEPRLLLLWRKACSRLFPRPASHPCECAPAARGSYPLPLSCSTDRLID